MSDQVGNQNVGFLMTRLIFKSCSQVECECQMYVINHSDDNVLFYVRVIFKVVYKKTIRNPNRFTSFSRYRPKKCSNLRAKCIGMIVGQFENVKTVIFTHALDF